MFILISCVFGSAGCTSRSHSRFINDNNDDSDPNPAPIPNSTFTVTFDSNGGSEVPSQEIEAGGIVILPDNPTKDGYVFAGWYKDNETFRDMFTFGESGDKVTQDITLYANWLEDNPDLYQTEYALIDITIGYKRGDNADHVTGNLTLPEKILISDEVNISWSSSKPEIISSNGNVTRPQGNDSKVILTATASTGNESQSKSFDVRVIRAIPYSGSNNVEVIELPDLESKEVSFDYDAGGNYVNYVEGKFSELAIKNPEVAFDVIQSLYKALGIASTYEELQLKNIDSNEYSTRYSFGQFYNGLRVYGRKIIVGADSKNEADSLSSSFLASDILKSADLTGSLTQFQAENIAKEDYSDDCEINSSLTEEVIFSLNDYKKSPVRAWLISISGTKKDGSTDAEDVFISAKDGKIIHRAESVSYMTDSYGFDELHQQDKILVPVTPEFSFFEGQNFNYMKDTDLNIEVFYGGLPGQFNRVRLGVNKLWMDRHQVSAYTNMRHVMQWWKRVMGRNSLDGHGMWVKLITHNSFEKDKGGNILTDNAVWRVKEKVIVACDAKEEPRSHSAAVDVLAHESTHAVMQFSVDEEFSKNTNMVAKTIQEAYADIFACIMDEDWKLGEDIFVNTGSIYDCVRNIIEPYSDKSISGSEEYLPGFAGKIERFNYNKGILDYVAYNLQAEEHIFSHYISHAAYLMHEAHDKTNGLTWEELRRLWYMTIREGAFYNHPEPKFKDVRREVLNAAKALLQRGILTHAKVSTIAKAFDEAGIYDTGAKLTGTITDYDTKKTIPEVTVVALKDFDNWVVFADAEADNKGKFFIQLDKSPFPYVIDIEKSGYVTFITTSTKHDSGKIVLNVQLVREGPGSVSGIIYDKNTSSPSPLEGVTVKIRSGFDMKDVEALQTTTTDSNGSYSFDLGATGAGYYTIEITKDGYTTSTFNVTVSGQTKWKDEYLEGKEATNPDTPTPDSVVTDVPIDESHFPDELFRRYVSYKIDANKDSKVSKTEIENTTKIDVSGYQGFSSIASLKGIEYFTELKELICSDTRLSELNVSNCTKLEWLNCTASALTKLDVNGCIALSSLFCERNQLLSLDVSDCIALHDLYCSGNQLTSLNLKNNLNLIWLYCGDNQLTVLNVYNPSVIRCEGNQLSNLDVSDCIDLSSLRCDDNQLTSLNLKNNVDLYYLSCQNNKIMTLDLSNCSNLNSSNVGCDDTVTVTWSDGTVTRDGQTITTNTTSVAATAPNAEITMKGMTIIASIPKFTSTRTGEYVFDVSLDTEIPGDNKLILLNNSEDLNGIFISDDNKNLKVSANFEAGQTYAPVIVVTSEENSGSGGGCNAGVMGFVLMFVVFVARRKVR